MKDKKKYIHWGLTVFLAGCALLIFYDVFYRDIPVRYRRFSPSCRPFSRPYFTAWAWPIFWPPL